MESTVVRLETSRCGDPGKIECHMAIWIYRTVPIIFLVIGTVGNLLNISVLMRKNMRRSSTSVYLLALAVSDLILLWVAILRHRSSAIDAENIRDLSPANCVVLEWLGNTAGGMSISLLVHLTVERTSFLKCQNFAKRVMTRKNATIATLVTLFTIMIFTSHLMFGFSLQEEKNATLNQNGTQIVYNKKCLLTSHSYQLFYQHIWIPLVLVFFSLIPLVIIVIGNSVIAGTLIIQRLRVNPNVLPQQQGSPLRNQGNIGTRISAATKVLLLLSVVFIVTTVPYGIFHVFLNSYYKEINENDERFASLQLLNAVTGHLLLVNYTFNFCLYFASGTTFKTECAAMMRDIQQKVQQLFEIMRSCIAVILESLIATDVQER